MYQQYVDLLSKYNVLTKTSMDGYWVLDSDGNIIFANQTQCDVYGYSLDELVGMNIKKFEVIEDDETTKKHLATIMSSGYDRFETQHYHKNGSILDIEVSTSFISEDEIFLAFTRNISERRSSEFALKSSELKYRSLYNSISDGLVIVDLDGKINEWNIYYEKMLGYSAEELSNLNFRDITPKKWHDFENKIIRENVLQNGYSELYEKEYICKDGSILPIELRPYLITDLNGKATGMWAIVRDVSERKHSEKQIKAVEEKFKSIASMSPDIISIINEDGTLAYNSPAAFTIHGYSEEEMHGRNTFELIHPDDQDTVSSAFTTLISNPTESVSVQYRYRHKDGTYSWMEATASNHLDNSLIRGVVTISRDISKRKQLEDEQIELDRKVMHLQKLESLGVLAGGIAHDFNNLLTGIIGNISYACKFIDESSMARVVLQNAEKAASRASELSNQLLTFAKGGQPIKKVASIKLILEEVTAFVLRGTNVSCCIEIPEDILSVYVDDGQINQALNNIIINASQAMPGGGVIIVCAENITIDHTNIMSLQQGDYIKVTIADTGCGISSDDLNRIFDPYFTTKAGGSGLGLATSHSIITKHGGYIMVHSAVGIGTTFEMLLPACDNDLNHEAALLTHQKVSAGNGLSVLIMDDEELIRDITQNILSDLGYHVQTCINGREAIALYKEAKNIENPYSAVIMDLTIPGGIGGREAAQQILALDQNARMIVSSGYSSDPVMAEYAAFGFSAILMKPYTSEELLRVLNAVLESPLES
jgi:PAS domain S-box-containing protein